MMWPISHHEAAVVLSVVSPQAQASRREGSARGSPRGHRIEASHKQDQNYIVVAIYGSGNAGICLAHLTARALQASATCRSVQASCLK